MTDRIVRSIIAAAVVIVVSAKMKEWARKK